MEHRRHFCVASYELAVAIIVLRVLAPSFYLHVVHYGSPTVLSQLLLRIHEIVLTRPQGVMHDLIISVDIVVHSTLDGVSLQPVCTETHFSVLI